MSRHYLNARRRYFDRRILATRPCVTGEDTRDFEVHALLGHKYVGMCLWSVKSFLHFSGRSFTVVLHDDGSLDRRDFAILETHLPNVRIIERAAADRAMRGALDKFPNAFRYRFGRLQRSITVAGAVDPYVFSLKLLDFSLLSEAPKILALDTDVLFFRKPTEIIGWVDDRELTNALYCRELWVPIRGDTNAILRFERKEEPPKGFNSGLICLHRSAFDLTTLDQWLGTHLELVEKEYTFEQQAYNFLVRRSLAHGALPETYTFNFNDASCVATHFGIKPLFFANLPRLVKPLT